MIKSRASFLYSPINQVSLLILIDVVYRFEQRRRLAVAFKLVNQGLNIFAKTRAARTVGYIRPPLANAVISRHAPLEVFHLHIRESLAQPCPHTIPKRNVGQQ